MSKNTATKEGLSYLIFLDLCEYCAATAADPIQIKY